MISWIISVFITAGIFFGLWFLADEKRFYMAVMVALFLFLFAGLMLPIHALVEVCLK